MWGKKCFGMAVLCWGILALGAIERPMLLPEGIDPESKLPGGWYFSSYCSKPLPTLTYPTVEGKRVLHISQVQGPKGCRLDCYRRYPVLKGDRIVLTAEVRGKGLGTFTVQAYSNQKWMGHIGIKEFQVPSEWKRVRVSFDIVDLVQGGKNPTTDVICLFGVKPGTDVQVRGLYFEHHPSIAGTAHFPNVWTAFLPMDPAFQPSKAELMVVPKTLNGVSPRDVQFVGCEHDFKPDFKGRPGPLEHGAGNCVWLYGEIQADRAETYSIGAGADWWMQVHVNGEPVIDTLKSGNRMHPPRITDYQTTVKLKKGRNVLAVKYLTGGGSSVLAMGGAAELRGVGQKMRLVEVLWKDDFERAVKGGRTGHPELVQGEYSYALVAPSRQGRYSTTERLSFQPQTFEYVMPKIASGKHFGMSVRLIELSVPSRLVFRFQGAKSSCELSLERPAAGSSLSISLREGAKTVQSWTYPVRRLPADLLFTANALGEVKLMVETLVDSSVTYLLGQSAFFSGIDEGTFKTDAWLEPREQGRRAMALLDDWRYGYAMPDSLKQSIPMDIHVQSEFDPRKAGWKLVLDDDFEGDRLNQNLWFSYNDTPGVLTCHDGMVEVKPVRKKVGDRVIYQSGGFSSRKNYGYGYYEARLRVRRHPDWLTAFYLYGGQTGNSYLDGMEIDIYEDYYVTRENPLLDFNFHGFVGRILKSWNYVAKLPGSLDDFYTIGCKWTPFEVTYYLNGKAIRATANHSPHKTVTFDALNHRNGITPLRLCLSGKSRGRFRSGKPVADQGELNDSFLVDYVRYWAYPQDDDPVVEMHPVSGGMLVEPGQKFKLAASVKPNHRTKAKITGVYLFDSGCLIDYKSQPPYEFTVSIDEKYYAGTNYMRTGRSREKPNLQNVLHAYAIFAQDARGQVAHGDVVVRMTRPKKKSKPYQGHAQLIPGVVNPCHYDEGGNGVAYLDDNRNVSTFRPTEGVDANGTVIGNVITGEWVNMTVDIKRAGDYRVRLDYGAPSGYGGRLLMVLDDHRLVGTFDCPNQGGEGWGGLKSTLERVTLPAGRHVIKLIVIGAFNFSYLNFQSL